MQTSILYLINYLSHLVLYITTAISNHLDAGPMIRGRYENNHLGLHAFATILLVFHMIFFYDSYYLLNDWINILPW